MMRDLEAANLTAAALAAYVDAAVANDRRRSVPLLRSEAARLRATAASAPTKCIARRAVTVAEMLETTARIREAI